MNKVLETIQNRASCRQFQDKMISDEDLQNIIQAGIAAPTGRNLQSPIILVIKNKETIQTLSKINADIMGTTTDPFYHAPVVIVVLAKKDIRTHVYDGSCVMENMMIAATSLGVGSCWIHRARETFETEVGKAILKDLNIEDEYEGIGNLILGYPKGALEPKQHKANYVYYID